MRVSDKRHCPTNVSTAGKCSAIMCMLQESLACVWSAITTKKWHGRPVDTTAKEGDAVSLGRPLGTMKEAGYGVSQASCEYHSRREEYVV